MPVACPYNMYRQRKHIRLRNFDYASANAYFITICVKYFVCVFGEIRNGIMGFSDSGNEAAICLQKIPELHQNFELDEFVVMPNHVHCILTITQSKNEAFCSNEYRKLKAGSVSSIVNQYKGAVKNGVITTGLRGLNGREDFTTMLLEMTMNIGRSKIILSTILQIGKGINFSRRDLPLANPFHFNTVMDKTIKHIVYVLK